MRAIHRLIATTIVAFILYFATTGSVLQLVDLRAFASGRGATDPDIMATRESIDGPSNFSVIAPPDYAAPALPENFDFSGVLANALKSRRSTAAGTPLKYVELRVVDGMPSAQLLAGDRVLRFDPGKGSLLPLATLPAREGPLPSLHDAVKRWHRMQVFGDGILWWNALVGLGLLVIILTGLLMYFQLMRAAARMRHIGPFWFSGGWWRSLHRWISLAAALFLIVVAVSGTLLSIDSLSLFIYRVVEPPEKLVRGLFPLGMISDQSSPLPEDRLPVMLNTTLNAYRAKHADIPIKVLRLRYFAGIPQAVIIAGGNDIRQLVFNADTGKRMSMSEPGYPYTGFPFGWEEHELMKRIHRGDAFGMPGRVFSLFAGLSLAFLSLSGLVMYIDLWTKRRRAGRAEIYWR